MSLTMKSSRKVLVAAAAAILLTTLAACAPGNAAGPGGASEKPSTDLGSAPITLRVVTTPESGKPLDSIVAAFEDEHPNVTVKVESATFDDYNKGLALSLASDDAPDVVLLNLIGNLAKNSLVLPLNGYADLYSWNDSVPSSLRAQWSTDKDFSSLGGDTLYAMPTSLTLVGLFYNKALAAQIGLDGPPSTFDEFTADLAAAKAAGVLPIQLGNAEGHASFFVQGIGQSIDGAASANDWALGKSGTFDTKGNLAGATALVDWVDKGYVPADANGADLQTAVTAFVGGKGLFLNDGNWDAGTIGAGLGDDAGFISFPGAKATAIGGSIAYGISSKSEHPNAAAAFLDFLKSDDAAPAQFEAGFLPVNVSAVTSSTPLQQDIIDALAKVNADDGIVAFNNNVTPTIVDTLRVGTQELIGHQTDPKSFVKTVQSDWESNRP